jgi:hypothetical protein
LAREDKQHMHVTLPRGTFFLSIFEYSHAFSLGYGVFFFFLVHASLALVISQFGVICLWKAQDIYGSGSRKQFNIVDAHIATLLTCLRKYIKHGDILVQPLKVQ